MHIYLLFDSMSFFGYWDRWASDFFVCFLYIFMRSCSWTDNPLSIFFKILHWFIFWKTVSGCSKYRFFKDVVRFITERWRLIILSLSRKSGEVGFTDLVFKSSLFVNIHVDFRVLVRRWVYCKSIWLILGKSDDLILVSVIARWF